MGSSDSLTSGILYYSRGRKCVVRMIVSMLTLRRHYHGPVALFLDDCGFGKDNLARLAEDVKGEFDVDVVLDENDQTTTYVRAVEVCMKSPYDIATWMDADTVISGGLDELFEEARTHDLAIAHFAGWSSHGATIGGRIRRYQAICPQYIDAALRYGPAINCGVYSFRKDSPFLPEWLVIAKEGEKAGIWIPDEIACQVLLPQYNCKIMPEKFNVSVIHDKGTTDVRCTHFHGRKHVLNHPSCDVWIEWFMRALRDNTCHIRNYIGAEFGDRRLTHFLKGETGRPETISIINAILASEPGTYDLSQHNPLVRPVIKTPAPAVTALEEADPDEKDEDAVSRSEPPVDVGAVDAHVVDPGVPALSTDEGPVDPSLVTVVTACDPKYVEHLSVTFPNWVRFKNILQYRVVVFVNGIPLDDRRLDFLRHPGVKLVPWAMPGIGDHREEMLSAFVLGTAGHVETPYWLKLDADSYATDDRPLLVKWMTTVAFCGHWWGYSWTEHIKAMDRWAAGHPKLVLSPLWGKPMYEKEHDRGRRYYHPGKRTISFVQLQETKFTRICAGLAGGRLPIPSHDTYLYYMADRMGVPWRSSNFKGRRGFTQGRDLEGLRKTIGGMK